MSRRAFVIFGAFAAVFAIVIPFFAIEDTGGQGASIKPIATSDHTAQQLFQTNCGTCHTLAAAGTDGVVGPNLDVLLAAGAQESQATVDGNCSRVLSAIEGGIGGRMPKGILQGDNAETVANFVARNVNYLGQAPPAGGTAAASSATAGSQPSGPITASSTKCASQSQPTPAVDQGSSSSSG
jgi:mono/diheme cytochrome c family protein